MLPLSSVISVLETYAPKAYQENYDNSGLATGDPAMEITGILVCLDVTPEIIEEAIQNKSGKNAGKRTLWFNGRRRSKKSGMSEDYCKPQFERYLAEDFTRIAKSS